MLRTPSILLFLPLLTAAAALPLCVSCRDRGSREYFIRRITLSNTPEDVSRELTESMLCGDIARMLLLSTPSVADKLRNEFALTDPGATFEEAMRRYSDQLKQTWRNASLDSLTETPGKNDENIRTVTAALVMPDNTKQTVIWQIVRDNNGNWKNDSRL